MDLPSWRTIGKKIQESTDCYIVTGDEMSMFSLFLSFNSESVQQSKIIILGDRNNLTKELEKELMKILPSSYITIIPGKKIYSKISEEYDILIITSTRGSYSLEDKKWKIKRVYNLLPKFRCEAIKKHIDFEEWKEFWVEFPEFFTFINKFPEIGGERVKILILIKKGWAEGLNLYYFIHFLT